MKHNIQRSVVGTLIVILLGTGALLAPAAQAQVNATAGVVGSNVDGTHVTCPQPSFGTGGVFVGLVACSVNASASGFSIDNFCAEAASASVGPVNGNISVLGCSVSVTGSIAAAVTVTCLDDDCVEKAWTCSGVGLGTATYSPAPDSAGTSMQGPVILKYSSGVLTAEGALVRVGTRVSAGAIAGQGDDPCGPDFLAHLFTVTIN